MHANKNRITAVFILPRGVPLRLLVNEQHQRQDESCHKNMSDSWLSKNFRFNPDLDAYFARISYNGSREVCLDTLNKIQWHHLLVVPFECLDVHLIHCIDLTPAKLEQKIVHDNRGGYCYEQNIYLLHVLRALGFDVTPVLARTRWQKPLDIVNPATHLVLKVKLEGVLYMFDVGFSSYGSPVPLEIETDRVQPTPLEPRRIVKVDSGYIHQMQLSDGIWRDVFIFTLEESHPFDWEVGSFWVSTNPASFNVTNIIVSMPTESSRLLLLNKTLKTSHLDGTTEIHEVESEEEYFELLRSRFGMVFPSGTRLCPPNTTW